MLCLSSTTADVAGLRTVRTLPGSAMHGGTLVYIWSCMADLRHIWAFAGFQAAIYGVDMVCPPRTAALVRFVRHICGCSVMIWQFLSCLRCPLLGRCKAWRLVLSCVWRSGARSGCCSCSVAFRIDCFLGCCCDVEDIRSDTDARDGFVFPWKKVSMCDGKKTTLNCCMSTLWCVRGEIGKKC